MRERYRGVLEPIGGAWRSRGGCSAPQTHELGRWPTGDTHTPAVRAQAGKSVAMDDDALGAFIHRQNGVFSRSQVLLAGGDDAVIRRRIRRHEWRQVHLGVYVNHTGPLDDRQREWAAVLYYAPAALGGGSALRRYGVRTGRDSEPDHEVAIEIAVDRARRVRSLPGVRVRRITRFPDRVLANLSPPRLRLEDAVLDVAGSAGDEATAVGVLADACRSRRTTAARILRALDGRERMRRRAFLRSVLDDVASGAHSLLEWRYLVHVERQHGLPRGKRQRQVRAGRTRAHRDVDYLDLHTIVELDGRLGHTLAGDRWSDLDRDVHAATGGSITLRLGWRQVLEPCRLAAAVATILIARGWRGRPVGCSPTCPVELISGVEQPRGDCGTPRTC